MRPNVARKRCTYDWSAVDSRESYFCLRLDPMVGPRQIAGCIWATVFHTFGAALTVTIIGLLPSAGLLVHCGCLLLLGVVAVRWVADALASPLGLWLLAACIAGFFGAASQVDADLLTQHVVGAMAGMYVFMLLPFVMLFSVQSSRTATAWLLSILTAAAMLRLVAAVPELWVFLSALRMALLGFWCVCLVRDFSSRIAADWTTPTAASYALVDFARSLRDLRRTRNRKWPNRRWWGCALASGWGACAAWQLLVHVPHASPDGTSADTVVRLGVATTTSVLISCAVLRMSLLRYLISAVSGFNFAVVQWWGDPEPHGVPRRAFNYSWRWCLTFLLTVLTSLWWIAASPPGDSFQWQPTWSEASYSDCFQMASLVVLRSVPLVIVAAGLTCGPWMAYIASTVRDARK